MGFIRTILGLVTALIIIAFALQNRTAIDVTLSPMHAPYTLPVYAIALAGMLLGFLLGGFMVWLNAATTRRDKRKQKKQIKTLEKEVTNLQSVEPTNKTPPSDFFPALPKK